MAVDSTLVDPFAEKHIYTRRALVASLCVLIALSLIAGRYFFLQVIERDKYHTQSNRNRVQLQPIPPKRGLIYDRNSVILAENRPSYSLTIIKERVEDIDITLDLLQTLLKIDIDLVEKFDHLLQRSRPYVAIPLKLRLTEEEIAVIAVNRYRLPGVEVKAQLIRHYPMGEYFAHALGYVGRINMEEQLVIDEVNYRGTSVIGKIGLEKHYETTLFGKVGFQNVETNARGRVLRVLERTDPEPGTDITLHMDAHVQKVAHEALGDKRGAVVALDPRTGGIIAMVSTPSFDANLFVGGISRRDYNTLRNSPDLPLFNRALQGQYPPASTVKPIYALGGLHYGLITEKTKVRDPGWYQLPNDTRFYRDWTWHKKRRGHAPTVALEQAIVESCDTYFYSLAHKMGIDRIHEFLSPFGIGAKTDIDNTNERTGLLPSREWKRRIKRLPWFPGETLSIGIGQGYMLVTPLQLAVATAAIAARGGQFKPKIVRRLQDIDIPVEKLPAIEVADRHWETVIKAMQNVVHGSRGTANRISPGAKYRMAGKTGTAQVLGIKQNEKYDAEQIAQRYRDHGLFVGFAPVDDPKIVVAVVVENAEHGSWVAPVARKVFDAYLLDQKML